MTTHKYTSNHREQVLISVICGCFQCLAIFKPSKIVNWCDRYQTAMCPHCHVDAVVGSGSGYEINDKLLREMNKKSFGR